jgi:beta-barrel assembly-enhancing protease
MNTLAEFFKGSSWKKALLVGAFGVLVAASLPVRVSAQAPAEPAPPPADQPQASSPAQPPDQPQASAPTQPPDQGTAQPAPSQPVQAQPQPAAKDAPIPQQDNPKVKAGSEADVDAIGNRGVGKGVNFYSIEREVALGKQLAQQVERTSKLIDDPVVTEYVNRVGQNLVRNSDAKVPFTIKVIDSDQINAFALPGGFFYVNSGLILAADSEAELAGVMAHETAHVAARHGTKDATKGEIAQLATIPLMMLGPGGLAGLGLYEGLNIGIPLSFLQFSRDHEFEADYLGLEYMYKAGYDPNAFVTFFEKVEAQEKRQPGTIPKVFSTHPPTPERVKAIQKEIGEVLPARDQYIVTTSEFDSVKARLKGIENRTKVQAPDNRSGNRPTLRTRSESQPAGGTAGGTQPQTTADPNDDPDRPTLHKRSEDDPNAQ